MLFMYDTFDFTLWRVYIVFKLLKLLNVIYLDYIDFDNILYYEIRYFTIIISVQAAIAVGSIPIL